MEQPAADRILLVCTANICRSPMAEALLRSRLAQRQVAVTVSSAGFLAAGNPADRNVLWAMSRVGLDLSGHSSALAQAAVKENPDLILTMAREHLRSLSRIDAELLHRAFTLKEFVTLGDVEGQRRPNEPMGEYVTRLGRNRGAGSVFAPGSELDVEDPIGRRRTAFARCAEELQDLVARTSDLLYPIAEAGAYR